MQPLDETVQVVVIAGSVISTTSTAEKFPFKRFLKTFSLETNEVVVLMQKFLRCVGLITKFHALLFIISNRHKYVAALSMAIATTVA